MTEERDILKEGRSVLCQGVSAKCAFMKAHQQEFRVTTVCRVQGVQRTGPYAWLTARVSDRRKEDRRLSALVQQAWLESGTVCGYCNVVDDLRDLGGDLWQAQDLSADAGLMAQDAGPVWPPTAAARRSIVGGSAEPA